MQTSGLHEHMFTLTQAHTHVCTLVHIHMHIHACIFMHAHKRIYSSKTGEGTGKYKVTIKTAKMTLALSPLCLTSQYVTGPRPKGVQVTTPSWDQVCSVSSYGNLRC